MTTRNWEALKEKVRNGATLYLSWSETFLDELDQVAGVELDYREARAQKLDLAFDLPEGGFRYSVTLPVLRHFIPCGAEVLAKSTDGEPFFFRHRYGKGYVYTLGFPLEEMVQGACGGFNGDAWRIWRTICPVTRLVETASPAVNASEHFFSADRCAAVIVNNGAEAYSDVPKLTTGWKVVSSATDDEKTAVWRDNRLELAAHAGIVLELQR